MSKVPRQSRKPLDVSEIVFSGTEEFVGKKIVDLGKFSGEKIQFKFNPGDKILRTGKFVVHFNKIDRTLTYGKKGSKATIEGMNKFVTADGTKLIVNGPDQLDDLLIFDNEAVLLNISLGGDEKAASKEDAGISGADADHAAMYFESVLKDAGPNVLLDYACKMQEMFSPDLEVVGEGDTILRLIPKARTETALLEEGGFDVRDHRSAGPIAVESATGEFRELVATSLPLPQVARILKSDAESVRGRIESPAPDLYAFRWQDSWRVPAVLFRDGAELVPHVDRVVRALRPGMHPIAFRNWFTTPNPDLSTGESAEDDLSPKDWLCSDRDPERVVRIAESVEA